MIRRKNVVVNDNVKAIRLEFSDNETYFGDTSVTIYDDYKISIALTDDCGAVIGNNVLFPRRGDMIIFRPEEIHFGRFPRLSEYKFLSVFIPVDFFESSFTASKSIISPFLDIADDKINLISLPESEKNNLIDIAVEILMMMKEEPPCFDLLVFNRIVQILNICNKFYPVQKSAPNCTSVPPIITKAMTVIDERFPDFEGLNELSVHCGCSVTYLTQTFREYTGKTIHGYLTERRLEQARRLLQSGAGVTQVCYQTGFSDCSAFIRLFKKHFGITPGKYNDE